jgi:O-antigen/teichoic acid export membrane protein
LPHSTLHALFGKISRIAGTAASSIRLKLREQFKGDFLRSVAVLAGGTAFAQGLPILVTPLLTRLYRPEDFGVLAVFSALLGMVSVIVGLQYEAAIPIPHRDDSAANVLGVALCCVAATSGLTTIAIALFGQEIADLLKMTAVARYRWLLPIGIAGTGVYVTFQFWAVRRRAFPRIARTKLVQSTGGAVTQLLLGWTGAGPLGLIAGQLVNSCAGSFGLARGAFREDIKALREISLGGMKRAAADFRRFPQFTAVEALANAAAIQLPILLIARTAAGAEVGFLMLGMRLMQTPMSLIGSSVSQVYYAHAVTEHRQGRIAGFTADVVGRLARVGAGPLIFIGIIAPSVFPLVFGSGWQRAGVLVAWMTPWFVLQFLSSPVSMVLYVTSNQLAAMALQVSGLVVRVAAVIVAATWIGGHPVAEAYALSGLGFYLAYLIAVCRVSKISLRQFLVSCRAAAIPTSAWAVAGMVIALVV